MENEKMVIEIWSDVACPFCYLGKHRFETALKEFPDKDRIKVVWKSFELNPHLKTDTSVNIYEYLSSVKGMNAEQIQEISRYLSGSSEEAGLELNFDRIVVANTFRAHCLLQYSKNMGKQNEMEERLFRAYFTEGQNVDDVDTLIIMAKDVGLDTSNLEEMLENKSNSEDVRRDIYEAHQLDIQGVPFFVFNNKYGISGAQGISLFTEVLEKSFSEFIQA